MSEIERLNRYAEALAERHIALRGPSFKDLARAVLAVADAEQAELRADRDKWQKAALTLDAELKAVRGIR